MARDPGADRDGGDTGGPLTIRIPAEDLPDEPEKRAQIQQALQESLPEVLAAESDVDIDRPAVHDGHQFAQLPMECPRCGADLHFSPVSLDPPSGAIAPVECQNRQCSLSARGQFKLVDLRWNDVGTDRSAVAEGEIEPLYRPYRNEDL